MNAMGGKISRRALLNGIGFMTVSGALAACTPIQAPTPTLPATPTPMQLLPEDEARVQKIETLLNAYHDAGFFTGAVLIARDGQILLSKAWGLADRKNDLHNTPQTIFRVGEITM